MYWSGSGLTCTGGPSTFYVAYTGPSNVADVWRLTAVGVGADTVHFLYFDLVGLVERRGFQPHLYADDTHAYGSCRPSAVADFQVRLSACVDDVTAWMLANRQLNTGKTDLLWCATAHRCHQLPTSALRIESAFLNPSKSVRDLGIHFDSDRSM